MSLLPERYNPVVVCRTPHARWARWAVAACCALVCTASLLDARGVPVLGAVVGVLELHGAVLAAHLAKVVLGALGVFIAATSFLVNLLRGDSFQFMRVNQDFVGGYKGLLWSLSDTLSVVKWTSLLAGVTWGLYGAGLQPTPLLVVVCGGVVLLGYYVYESVAALVDLLRFLSDDVDTELLKHRRTLQKYTPPAHLQTEEEAVVPPPAKATAPTAVDKPRSGRG